jgi:hypothetical protein
MIVFATSITDPDVYRRCAQPGIERAREPDSEVTPIAAAGSIFRSYNLIMDKLADREDVEALVLVHQDAEITSEDFCATVRRTLADPDVGLIGCVGAIGVRSIAWWEGSVTWASFTHRYGELGGGELPAFSYGGQEMPAYARTGEVDTIDGFIIVVSPWVLRNVRFDESLGALHGYDFDFCLQVRDAGRKVVTADFAMIHHHSLELVSNPDTWIEAHMKVADKWDGRMPGVGFNAGSWQERARRAEAEAAVTRARAVSIQMQGDARLAQLRKEFEEISTSTSWRLTRPLRELMLLFRRPRAR